MDLGLTGRVALVTGSSQGIGKVTAELLAREGTHVAVTYHAEREKADAVVEHIRRQGADALSCQMDLASPPSIRLAVDAVLRHWGRIDILVNNAVDWGVRMPGSAPPFEEFPADEWQRLLRTNLEGALVAVQSVLPAMKERGWGRIVNISSTVVVDGMPGFAWYSAAKAGLHGLSATLSKELSGFDILVNAVMPGPTITERVVSKMPEFTRRFSASPSSRRRALTPADIAPMIVFLCSAQNTSVTGQAIAVTAGLPSVDTPLGPRATRPA